MLLEKRALDIVVCLLSIVYCLLPVAYGILPVRGNWKRLQDTQPKGGVDHETIKNKRNI